MQRTSLFIDPSLIERAQRHARKHGVSFATVVREALASYLDRTAATALPSFAGRFHSGTRDTASRVDELLWDEPHE